MTNLPEDLNRWPTDPFKLLGLERTTDARTARRAYFKLVKKYKPDRFPNEFQKVREAYDQVEQWLKWNVAPRSDLEDLVDQGGESTEWKVPSERNAAPNAETEESYSAKEQEDEFDSLAPGSTIGSDPFDQFQQSLESADFPAAVAAINQVGSSSGPSQIARANLTKYFLSRFLPNGMGTADSSTCTADAPVSDLERKRISWLMKSIRCAEFYHAASHLLRSEFDRNYRLADCKPVRKFLADFDDYPKLAEIYRLRWEAIGHSDWQLVMNDVDTLKPKSLGFDDSSAVWVDLLAASMEYTVWQKDERCFRHNKECWREISESQRSWTADSVELMVLAAEQWHAMRETFQWSAALPWARITLPRTIRRIWLPVATSIAADRTRSLYKLNQIYRRYPIAMSYFEEGLQQLAGLKTMVETDESWNETRDLVACFFDKGSRKDYVLARNNVLDFCVNNQLEPMSFAHAASSFLSPEAPVSWSELIQNDGPLMCVFNACKSVDF